MSRHEHRRDWRPIVFYATVSLLVLVIAVFVLWTFFEKQALQREIAAESLPKIAVIYDAPEARLAAAWVSVLTDAGFSATLVPQESDTPTGESLPALCSSTPLPPRLRTFINGRLAEGEGLLILGSSPPRLLAPLKTTVAKSSGAIRIVKSPSPIVARVQPEYEIGASSVDVHTIEETPAMSVDARWSNDSRAAVAHFGIDRARVVWLGFDPGALWVPKDRQLAVLLRAALRWVAGQPVSDAAIGGIAEAKALNAAARVAARKQKLAFSVDRLDDRGGLIVRVINKGAARLENATVKVWLPPRASRCHLAGSFMLRRGVVLSSDPVERAVLVTTPTLEPYETRVVHLKAE